MAEITLDQMHVQKAQEIKAEIANTGSAILHIFSDDDLDVFKIIKIVGDDYLMEEKTHLICNDDGDYDVVEFWVYFGEQIDNE